MSSDLLAEFDSFYRAPQVKTSTNSAETVPKTTALDDLSFLGESQHQSKVSESTAAAPKLKENVAEWGYSGSSKLSTSSQVQQTDPDFDGWGDFEDPAPAAREEESFGNCTSSFGDDLSVLDKRKPMVIRPGIVRVSTADLFSNSISDLAESSARHGNDMSHKHSTYTPPLPKPAKFPPPAKNVLFDAEYEMDERKEERGDDDDDDFGDFETVLETDPAAEKPSSSESFESDLLQIESTPVTQVQQSKNYPRLSPTTFTSNQFPYPQAPKSPSFQERNPYADLALRTHVGNTKEDKKVLRTTESPLTAWPVYEPSVPKTASYVDSPIPRTNDDDWGDFEDLPPTTPKKIHKTIEDSKRIPKQASSLLGTTSAPSETNRDLPDDPWAWDSADQNIQQTTSAPVDFSPPTNIPPPSVLLALFPQLLNLPETTLFRPVVNQSPSLKTRIMSDPATIDFLRAYVGLSTVAAHLIAGRKLRWKRDTHLSQGMRIGPAGSSKGGMKLTGVVKAESTREDRETLDVVRIWKEQVGRLRAAVTIANSSIRDKSAHLVIPEFNESMTVKTVSMAEGGLSMPKACILCGLKRDERVSKVDLQVEDSFGEWWIEHWGHRTCRNFWQEHESKLKGR